MRSGSSSLTSATPSRGVRRHDLVPFLHEMLLKVQRISFSSSITRILCDIVPASLSSRHSLAAAA